MTTSIKNTVVERLKQIKGPDLEGDIVSLGLVSDVFVSDGRVAFSITVPAARANELEPLRLAAEKAVKEVPGVETAMVALTAERKPTEQRANSQPKRKTPTPSRREEAGSQKTGVPGVAHIIAVASGKGGVGKSTTTVNLAVAMAKLGKKIGVLDADIYGPSIPRLLNVSGRPEPLDGRQLKPLEAYGLKVMSMGFMVEEETPMIWRGPMVVSAITQMLREVAWGELDVLVVDMPPGTGDAQLTMAQQVPLSGAVIVSTPQDLALIDARKGLNMFKRVSVPVLGLIENMSYFICPDCGSRHDIFSHGGARKESENISVPFLGEIPLTMNIRESSDAGSPITNAEPDTPVTKAYTDIAAKVLTSLTQAEGASGRAAPKIVFE